MLIIGAVLTYKQLKSLETNNREQVENISSPQAIAQKRRGVYRYI